MNEIYNDFCVFILTNGRAEKVYTYETLRKCGYTGKIYLLIDDEDKEKEKYIEKYKNEVIIFPKQKAIDITDDGDNFKKRNSVVYARNYNFVIAKEMGIKYFLQLDDDYTEFIYTFDNDKNYIRKQIKIENLNKIIYATLDFYKKTNILTLAWSQGGDFIGGDNSKVSKMYMQGKMARKAMNSFFCSVDRPFKFSGRINEDVNAYLDLGCKGNLFFTFARIRLEQKITQSNSGGLTDIYLDLGTYVKSFYSVIYSPSCVKIFEMGVSEKRLHHRINWKNAVPCILDEKYKK